MRNNKILATAMTTALAGALSAGGVNAGTLEVIYPTGSNYKIPPQTTAMSVPTEEIAANQILPDLCSSTITVNYTLSDDGEKLDLNDLITIELLEGTSLAETAVLDTNPNPVATTTISPGALVIRSNDGGSGTFALSGGGEDTNTLQFIVQSGGVGNKSTLAFTFCVGKADILKEQGQSIGISFTMTNGKSASQTILSAVQGSQAVLDGGIDDGKVKVNIGSDAGAKNLTGSSISEDTAILGEICLDVNDAAGSLYQNTLAAPWLFSLTGYQLTVTDAPFNASIGHTYDPETYDPADPEQLAGVMVFLDVGQNGVLDPEDIPADTVDTTSASFTIADIAELTPVKNDEGKYIKNCADLVFKVSGNDEIKTHDVPPTGKLTLTFGDVTTEFSGKLNHIKRSGTVCVLYNIPGPNSIENANIRVTNKSATPDGTLIGTLRLPDGTEIFTDFDILTASGLGLIGANQTMYLNTDTLNTIAQSASNPNGAWTDGWSRAILRLETNLDTVEMMALIRDDDVMGAPLMNMSTGASGNGCGR
jgi:hypothetical protein